MGETTVDAHNSHPLCKWYMTDDIELAITEYIGETIIIPNVLTNCIRTVLGLSTYQEQLLFYYGKPSPELRFRFGYEEVIDYMPRAVVDIYDEALREFGNNQSHPIYDFTMYNDKWV